MLNEGLPCNYRVSNLKKYSCFNTANCEELNSFWIDVWKKIDRMEFSRMAQQTGNNEMLIA
jgi:hypothetical protein